MQRYIVRNIGNNKGQPRVYLDIHALTNAGFEPGKTYNRTVEVETKRVTLTLESNGSHLVSKKESAGKVLPVIDINSSKALSVFEGMTAVRIVVEDKTIHILPLASETKRLERLERLKRHLDEGEITTAGISFGGGVLDHAAHTGLKKAGINARLAMANEIDEDLLEHASQHNDIWVNSTIGIAAPLQELVQDDAAMRRIPKTDLVCLGLPCSGASKAGAVKRGLQKMEDHPEVGHLIASAIMVLNKISPAVVVLENVVGYSTSASAQILRQHLRDSGYVVQETILGAKDFGSLENRIRWFMVGATAGIDIDLQDLQPKLLEVRKLGDLLEDIGPDAPDWRTFDYLKTKAVRDQEKGNSFTMQIVTPESTSCPTIRKGYHKGGSTDPLLAHPTNPDLLRQLTVVEHGRVKDAPESIIKMAAALGKVGGHSLLGQGIAYVPVSDLFKRIGQCILKWKEGLSLLQSQTVGYSLMKATG